MPRSGLEGLIARPVGLHPFPPALLVAGASIPGTITVRGDPMHHRTTLLLATLLLAGAAAGCGASGDDAKPKHKATAAAAAPATSAAPEKLEPIWGPKLKKAAGEDSEAVSACNQPSSNACARYIEDIMSVATGLEAEIKKTGRAYPKSLEQIGKMKDAQAEYEANGCQGDITAEDPNSQCHGVVGITMGATTLGITLLTDEVGM